MAVTLFEQFVRDGTKGDVKGRRASQKKTEEQEKPGEKGEAKEKEKEKEKETETALKCCQHLVVAKPSSLQICKRELIIDSTMFFKPCGGQVL